MVQCERCGANHSAPEALCARCLLEVAMAADEGPAARASASRGFGRPTIPTPEELAPLFPELELEGSIGSGGMGAVYRATQRALGRRVALKVLHEGLSEDPTFARRFEREARTLAGLSHPSCVAIHDFGERGDSPVRIRIQRWNGGFRAHEEPLDGTAGPTVQYRGVELMPRDAHLWERGAGVEPLPDEATAREADFPRTADGETVWMTSDLTELGFGGSEAVAIAGTLAALRDHHLESEWSSTTMRWDEEGTSTSRSLPSTSGRSSPAGPRPSSER